MGYFLFLSTAAAATASVRGFPPAQERLRISCKEFWLRRRTPGEPEIGREATADSTRDGSHGRCARRRRQRALARRPLRGGNPLPSSTRQSRTPRAVLSSTRAAPAARPVPPARRSFTPTRPAGARAAGRPAGGESRARAADAVAAASVGAGHTRAPVCATTGQRVCAPPLPTAPGRPLSSHSVLFFLRRGVVAESYFRRVTVHRAYAERGVGGGGRAVQWSGQTAAGDVGEHGLRGASSAEPPSLGVPALHPASRTVVDGVGLAARLWPLCV